GFGGERRRLSASGDSTECLKQLSDDGRLRDQVDKTRGEGGQARPPVNKPHRVSVWRPHQPLVVMSNEHGFVRGHIHVHRALALTSFACKTEIERFLHRLVLPTSLHRVALKHLEKKMCSSPG